MNLRLGAPFAASLDSFKQFRGKQVPAWRMKKQIPRMSVRLTIPTN